MADYINMQETEYDDLQQKLAEMHTAIIAGEKEIREGINSLVEKGGGMYIKDISAKVTITLLYMGISVSTFIASSFHFSEEELAKFVDLIKEADVESS